MARLMAVRNMSVPTRTNTICGILWSRVWIYVPSYYSLGAPVSQHERRAPGPCQILIFPTNFLPTCRVYHVFSLRLQKQIKIFPKKSLYGDQELLFVINKILNSSECSLTQLWGPGYTWLVTRAARAPGMSDFIFHSQIKHYLAKISLLWR